jgi:WD40 repeat protein
MAVIGGTLRSRSATMAKSTIMMPFFLTIASDDNTARLWDRDGKPLVTLQGHTGPVTGAVFAPDGGRILTASEDTTARLWDPP